MFLPLHDENPTNIRFHPVMTWTIIGVSTVIFVVFQSGLVLPLSPEMVIAFGLIPSVLTGNNTIDPEVFHIPTMLTPLTYAFLHGNWMHLIGNMLFLWVFGDNVEYDLGRIPFLLFYLAAGAAAGIVFAVFTPTSNSPLVGASGSVAAILGAYLVLHPQVRIYGLIFNVIPVRLPALWLIGGWFLFQLGHASFDPDTSVAWLVHVVGLVIGALGMLAAVSI